MEAYCTREMRAMSKENIDKIEFEKEDEHFYMPPLGRSDFMITTRKGVDTYYISKRNGGKVQ